MNKKLILFLALMVFTGVSQAQWQPDVRLTNATGNSRTSENNIAASGNVLHVVWYDVRDGNFEIYYKRSSDGGLTWGTDTRLTNNSSHSGRPSVSVSGSAVHVVWYDSPDGNDEIYYKRSSDGGLSWGTNTRLTNNSAASLNPSVSVSGSAVHVVWDDDRDGNWNSEIYYKRSSDGGLSWGIDTRLTNNSYYSSSPSVSVSGSAVHVVWKDTRDGNDEIYYNRSSDGGLSWGTNTRLTNNSAWSYDPSVSVSGSAVHVVWRDDRDGNDEIYYNRSSDGGLSWGTDTRLTNNSSYSWSPSVSVSGSAVHVVWYDYPDGNAEIYYNRSSDGGLSWGTDTRLTNNSFNSYQPSVSVSGSAVHVVWEDDRDGNFEIFYKRDPTGNPIGIININTEIPKEFKLEQNYPNPFNPKTIINFQLPIFNYVRLIVFDVLGREVASLVNEELKPGTYEVDFDGSKYATGIYFYVIRTENFIDTKKMLLIK